MTSRTRDAACSSEQANGVGEHRHGVRTHEGGVHDHTSTGHGRGDERAAAVDIVVLSNKTSGRVRPRRRSGGNARRAREALAAQQHGRRPMSLSPNTAKSHVDAFHIDEAPLARSILHAHRTLRAANLHRGRSGRLRWRRHHCGVARH